MDDTAREERGRHTFRAVLGVEPRPPASPLTQAAQDFVFAEVWSRPGLDVRSRRWITLSAVTAAGSQTAMRTYAKAALASGDITLSELREFVLQFAVFQGFPKAVEFELILNEIEKSQG